MMIFTGNRGPDGAVYWVDRLSTPHDAATRVEFGRWLEESAQNRRDYVSQLELDDLLKRMPPSGDDVDKLLVAAAKEFQHAGKTERDNDDIDPDDSSGSAGRLSLILASAPWNHITAVTVCAVLIAGIAYAYFTRWVDYRADASIRTVWLQDGSEAVLFPHSHIRMRVLLSERQFVQESGTSSLDVHHDGSRRFFVDTPEARVEAVGTQLTVKRMEAFTDIFLRKGALRVRNNRAQTMALSAGQSMQITDGGDIGQPRSAEEMRTRPGLLMNVAGKTFAEVADAFNRNNVNVQFEILGDVAQAKAAGVVDLADPLSWMEVLRGDAMTVRFDADTGLARISADH